MTASRLRVAVPASEDIDALVKAWQLGDESACDAVLREVRRRSLRYLAGLRVPAHECEDLAQEVCIGVLAAVPGWRAQGTSLWALVFTIARNKHVDRIRKCVRSPELALDPDLNEPDRAPGPEEQVLLLESAGRTGALLATLPPNQRDVLLLRIVVGLNVAETADALDLKHGSVHVLQHRALTKLRTQLAANLPPEVSP